MLKKAQSALLLIINGKVGRYNEQVCDSKLGNRKANSEMQYVMNGSSVKM